MSNADDYVDGYIVGLARAMYEAHWQQNALPKGHLTKQWNDAARAAMDYFTRRDCRPPFSETEARVRELEAANAQVQEESDNYFTELRATQAELSTTRQQLSAARSTLGVIFMLARMEQKQRDTGATPNANPQ